MNEIQIVGGTLPTQSKPLTKSRFKLALECPTKLYYANQGEVYQDKSSDNGFLAALADGGHQVGALAKFRYHPDPIGQAITVEENGYAAAVAQTQRRLREPGRVVVAEAALSHESYFARVDLLIKDDANKRIELIEVKSKSVKEKDIQEGLAKPGWSPYLYDVAFQAEVASMVFPEWEIVPKLLLLDSDKPCDADGLHQQFRVEVDAGKRNVHVVVEPNVNCERFGSLDFMREVDVTQIVQRLRTSRVPAPHSIPEHTRTLREYMAWTAELQRDQRRHFGGVSKTCKDCQFRADAGDPKRSGVHECMRQAIAEGKLNGPTGELDRSKPLSIDIWGYASGPESMASRVLEARRALLADLQPQDIAPSKTVVSDSFTPFERRLAQAKAARDPSFKFDLKHKRLVTMDQWQWPLHMIDFETTATALPFFKGMRPYEVLAFQFSHHRMDRLDNGQVTIRHASQWISTEPGVFPSHEFVRQLRQALMPDGRLHGTVFRYHNHENTVLRGLRVSLFASQEPDRQDLIDFIDLITLPAKSESAGGNLVGNRAMVDLHKLVLEGYYSARAGGSLSLKHVLPAILQDAPILRHLYARPGVYGRGLLIDSLNFDGPQGQVWLQESTNWDPYGTLPPIFGPTHGELDRLLVRLVGEDVDDGSIRQGGAAMSAYNYTQFAQLPQVDRQRIRNALLRYCELDTLAMVMVVQGLMELRGKALDLKVP
jgi:hypothetical protein